MNSLLQNPSNAEIYSCDKLFDSARVNHAPSASELVTLFNAKFKAYNTCLEIGAKEPFYQAAKNNCQAIIFSTHDYFSSALHEIAHWCVAGSERRAQDDFGYWYSSDGRNLEQQKKFFAVEVQPQALEWAFSTAAGIPFRLSADNLFLDPKLIEDDLNNFKKDVYLQLQNYFFGGFPKRALQMIQLLCCNYRRGQPISLPRIEQCLS